MTIQLVRGSFNKPAYYTYSHLPTTGFTSRFISVRTALGSSNTHIEKVSITVSNYITWSNKIVTLIMYQSIT